MAKIDQYDNSVGINTRVVNQNDLLKIINASATTMKNVYNSIIALADACAFLKNMKVNRVKIELNKMIQLIPYIKHFVLDVSVQFRRLHSNVKVSIDDAAKLINSLGHFTMQMYEVIDTVCKSKIPKLSKLRVKLITLKLIYSKTLPSFIDLITKCIKDLSVNMSKIGKDMIDISSKIGALSKSVISAATKIDNFINDIISILKSINKIKLKSFILINTKMLAVHHVFISLLLLTSTLALMGPLLAIATTPLIWVSVNMSLMLLPVRILAGISIFKLWGINKKIKIIKKAWVSLGSIIRSVNRLKVGNKASLKRKLIVVSMILARMTKIFMQAIWAAPFALLAIPSLSIIILGTLGVMVAIKCVRWLLTIASRGLLKARARLLAIGLLFAALGHVFLITVLISPIAALAAAALIIITLATGVMALCLWGMTWMLSNVKWVKLMIGLFLLNVTMLLIVGLSVSLLIVALCASYVKDKLLDILILIGGIVMVTVIMGALGFAMSFVLPIIAPILLGLGAMLLVVGMVMLMAVALWALSLISLDQATIINNVKTVIGTAKEIISLLYNQDEEEPNGVDKPWYEDVFGVVGGSLAKLISAILAVAILAATVFSVFAILFIAVMLRLLQSLDLNKEKITENVKTVIGIANDVIDLIFNADDREATPSNLGVLGSIIDFIDPRLGKIVSAIFSLAFLAISATSIMIVLFIAGLLRMLQSLGLDKQKITDNLEIVTSAVTDIANVIFDTGDKEAKFSNLGVLGAIINFMDPRLGRMVDAIFSLAFLAVSLVSIMALKLIADKLKEIQDIDFDAEKVTANLTLVLSTVDKIISGVFEKDDSTNTPSEKGFLSKIISHLGDSKIVKIADAIMSVGLMAVSLAAISLVVLMAEELNKLNKINLNSTTISSKVDAVMNSAKAIVKSVFENTDGDAWVINGKSYDIEDSAEDIMDWFKNWPSAIKTIYNMVGWLQKLSKINSANLGAESSVFASKVDAITKSTKYIIEKLYNCQNEVVALGNYSSFKVAVKNISDNWLPVTNSLKEVDSVVKKLTDIANSDISLDTETKINAVINSVTNITKTIQTELGNIAQDRLNLDNISSLVDSLVKLNDALDYSDSQIKNTPKIFAETSKFVDKVNSMDLQKLKTAENLFKNLAELSTNIKGNFQGLAEALNEDIAPLLQKLNDTMAKTNETLAQTAKSSEDSMLRMEQYYAAAGGVAPDDNYLVDEGGAPLEGEAKDNAVKQRAKNVSDMLYKGYQDQVGNNEDLIRATSHLQGIDRLIAILDPNLHGTPLRVSF